MNDEPYYLCLRLAEAIGKRSKGQREAARRLGIAERTMRYYCAGREMPEELRQQLKAIVAEEEKKCRN